MLPWGNEVSVAADRLPCVNWERTTPSRAAGQLDSQHIHLWVGGLSRVDETLASEKECLSDPERSRAEAFTRDVDRERFIRAHAFKRRILSAYVGVSAKDLRFESTPDGKPELAWQQRSGLAFNISHSGDLVFVGVARDIAVGVDVEVVRAPHDLDALVRSTFSDRERRSFEALDAALQQEAFFAAWTRKEALIKAAGRGLSIEPHRVEVSIDPRLAPRVWAFDPFNAPKRRWTLWGARSSSAWFAAACCGQVRAVRRFLPPST